MCVGGVRSTPAQRSECVSVCVFISLQYACLISSFYWSLGARLVVFTSVFYPQRTGAFSSDSAYWDVPAANGPTSYIKPGTVDWSSFTDVWMSGLREWWRRTHLMSSPSRHRDQTSFDNHTQTGRLIFYGAVLHEHFFPHCFLEFDDDRGNSSLVWVISFNIYLVTLTRKTV